jgi:hypothetical protein
MSSRKRPPQPRTAPDADEPVVAPDLIETLAALGSGPCEVADVVDDPDWVRSTGKTPLEFLTAIYRHPLVRLSDRIAAAKTVADYTHRKMPNKVEVGGLEGGPLRVTASQLAGLSDEELASLEAILAKAQRSAS